MPLGLKNNRLLSYLSGLWCARPPITPTICPWATEAVRQQARPPAGRGPLHFPAGVDTGRSRLNSAVSSMQISKVGRPWGHRQLQPRRLSAALQIGCHLLLAFFGHGANVIQEELYYNIRLPKQTKRKCSVLILL